jgi:hypothetical protein
MYADLELIYAVPKALGATQEPAQATTSMSIADAAAASTVLPAGVELICTPSPERIGRRESVLQTRQLWDGTVTEIFEDGFGATLADRTNPNNPDEYAVFDYAEISDEDRDLVKTGAPFYWLIGREKTVSGQVKNLSMVQLRRLPAWTRAALDKASSRARRIQEIFGSEREPNNPT